MGPLRSFAIVPAAGHSTRMGRHKLLLPWGDRPLIDHLLSVWQASCVDRILVVVRRDDGELAERVVGDRVERVTADVDPPDMKASVCAALRWLDLHDRPSADDAWLMAPADMPYLSTLVIDHLVTRHIADPQTILVPTLEGRAGHPILLPWFRAAEVFELRENEGIRDLITRCKSERMDVREAGQGMQGGPHAAETPPATNSQLGEVDSQRGLPSLWQFQLDLDTPDDYEQATEREKSGETR